MFENFGTAIVQAVGFFGVFGFFVYRLLSERVSTDSLKDSTKKKTLKPVTSVSSEKKGLFRRKEKVELNTNETKKEMKRGWFKR